MYLIIGILGIALGTVGVRFKMKETELPGHIVHKFMILYGFGFGLIFSFCGAMDILASLGMVTP